MEISRPWKFPWPQKKQRPWKIPWPMEISMLGLMSGWTRGGVSSRQACWINGIDGLASVRRIFGYLNVYSKVLRDIWILVPGLAQCYMASEDLKGGKLPPHPFTVMPATPNIWMPHPPKLVHHHHSPVSFFFYHIPPTQTCELSERMLGRNLLRI